MNPPSRTGHCFKKGTLDRATPHEDVTVMQPHHVKAKCHSYELLCPVTLCLLCRISRVAHIRVVLLPVDLNQHAHPVQPHVKRPVIRHYMGLPDNSVREVHA